MDSYFADILADIPNFTTEELEYVKARIDEELGYRLNDTFIEYQGGCND